MSALNTAQINLLVLGASLVGVYYTYNEYIFIIAPIFIAITLYYASSDTISYVFGQYSSDVLNNKMYIIYALIALSLYLGYNNYSLMQHFTKSANIAKKQPFPEFSASTDTSF